ncbi:MAG: hypothetical protein HXS44_13005 [Theionarchaea archaeon]|nr:hypothetical protein [Theionarchaea archaeon]
MLELFLGFELNLKELLYYLLSLFAVIISLLSLYYTAFRGAKIRIAQVERIDFYPKFNYRGEYIGDIEIPIIIINDGMRIGVLSDLHLTVVEPAEYRQHIRTRQELEELPCPVRKQESVVFRIRKRDPFPIDPGIVYEIKITGITKGKEIYSFFRFLLKEEDWERLSLTKHYIKMLREDESFQE